VLYAKDGSSGNPTCIEGDSAAETDELNHSQGDVGLLVQYHITGDEEAHDDEITHNEASFTVGHEDEKPDSVEKEIDRQKPADLVENQVVVSTSSY